MARAGKTKTGEGHTERKPRGMREAEKAAVALAAKHPGLPNAEVARRLGLNSRSNIARRLGHGGDLRAHVRALLAEQGFDDRTIIKSWIRQAKAQEVRHFAHQGKVRDTRRVAALDVRTDALVNLSKLARLYPEAAEEERSRASGPLSLTISLTQATNAAPAAQGLTLDLGAPPQERARPLVVDQIPQDASRSLVVSEAVG